MKEVPADELHKYLGIWTVNYVGGKSTRGVGFYSGPCTPPNTMPHHYTFVLIATDFDPKELPPGLTRDEVIAKIAPDNWSACTREG